MTDERNFRSTYYEKVGCRSVEEKKSLNILLKDNPLNRIKLKQFCLSFTVPVSQRILLWHLLLGILPVYPDSREYVMDQREAVYNDCLRAVKIMRYVDEKTTKASIFYAMWLLENRKLHPNCNISQETAFIDIVEVLFQVFDSDVEIYWVAKEFYEFTVEIKSDLPKLKDLTFSLLEKEDTTLYRHFDSNCIIENLPFEKWYSKCFAGYLSEPALVRIWDKICGGSRKIVVFLFLAIVKTLRMVLMREKNVKNVIDIIERKKEDQDDLIVNKAIESWQSNKGHNEIIIHRKDN